MSVNRSDLMDSANEFRPIYASHIYGNSYRAKLSGDTVSKTDRLCYVVLHMDRNKLVRNMDQERGNKVLGNKVLVQGSKSVQDSKVLVQDNKLVQGSKVLVQGNKLVQGSKVLVQSSKLVPVHNNGYGRNDRRHLQTPEPPSKQQMLPTQEVFPSELSFGSKQGF